MKSIFSLRAEYRDYLNEGGDCSFREWFEAVYHYDMADEVPTGSSFDGSFRSFVHEMASL